MATSPDFPLYRARTRRENNWALVAFTVLSQMAVGMFASVTISGIAGNGMPLRGEGTVLATVIAASASLFLLGLLVSVAHVARPRRFLTMARNWRYSWLSREALLAPAFLLLSLGYFFFQPQYLFFLQTPQFSFLQLQMQAADRYLMAYLALTAVAGLAFILTQAMIYRLKSRSSWNHPHTMISFLATAAATGPAAVAMLFAAQVLVGSTYGQGLSAIAYWVALAASVMLILIPLQVLVEVTYLTHLRESGQEASASYETYMGKLRKFVVARATVGAVILALSGAVLASNVSSLPIQVTATVSLILFTAVLLAELLGRYIFIFGVVPLNPPVRYVELLGRSQAPISLRTGSKKPADTT